MKLIKISLSVLLLIPFLMSGLSAQTEFEGGIYNNVTWTKENSPYIITGNVVVFPDKILTVEPGVKITFTGDYYLEVRGNIIMEGTKDDTIKVISNYLPTPENEWTGIIINYPQAEFSVSYCRFDSLMYGISIREYKLYDSLKIAHSIFSHCVFGIQGTFIWDTIQVDSCYFYKNMTGISSQEGLSVTNSFFSENNIALFEPRLMEISNTEFYNNDTAILLGSEGHITNCIFKDNYLAISLREWGMTLVGNTIQNNHIGLQLSYFWIDMVLPVEGNKICNNTLYNVENLDKYNKSVKNNCWCLTDSAEIEAKLWDGYDDITVGLLNYDIYDNQCDTRLKSVVKIEISDPFIGIMRSSRDKNIIQIHPIPAHNFLCIQISGNENIPGELFLYSPDGKLIRQIIIQESSELLDLHNLEPGVYIVRIHLKNSISISHLIIKE